MKYCSINGKQQTTLAVTDRGLAYGDGIFTTAKIVNGQVLLLEKHIERLTHGCQYLKLKLPTNINLQKQLADVVKGFSLAVLKVMITAGSGGRGYSRFGLTENSANLIIMISDFPRQYELLAQQGITLGDSKQQISTSPMLGGIKHLNRLEQVLLRDELDKRIEDDLIVTNCQGNVIEATSSNIFYWHNEQLCTPEISTSGVNGIIRQAIIAKKNDIKICQTRLEDLKHAQAMFISNSLMGIMPVKTYNNRKLTLDMVLNIQKEMKSFI
ncbi:aminodeoxychorismate lyase [Colwellia psychrerythraea]|uniref:Aminodeoxychorismate lyase n=1 Tax=Colwellia psychrerythraea TaxID=28229 RepID=A0A099KH08_COLPS|nr:aminodeoxychorismate lyase [Colwellia psychrerythraea]KGJ90069.1 aminodeoxychorismate lyase [Colwellia psychrerythraea]